MVDTRSSRYELHTTQICMSTQFVMPNRALNKSGMMDLYRWIKLDIYKFIYFFWFYCTCAMLCDAGADGLGAAHTTTFTSGFSFPSIALIWSMISTCTSSSSTLPLIVVVLPPARQHKHALQCHCVACWHSLRDWNLKGVGKPVVSFLYSKPADAASGSSSGTRKQAKCKSQHMWHPHVIVTSVTPSPLSSWATSMSIVGMSSSSCSTYCNSRHLC